jgi:hypothetical protein
MSRLHIMNLRTPVLLIAALGVLCLGLVAAPAGAAACVGCEPWWNVVQSARPSNVQPGAGKDEVQELRVAATGGEVVLEGPHGKFAGFAWNADAATVQGVLEGLFGAGNVTVSGGPGDATASTPYMVRFEGELSEDGQAPITSPGLSREAEARLGLVGEELQGEASVVVATAAAPDGIITVQAVNAGDAGTTGAATLSDVLPEGLSIVENEGVPQVGFFSLAVGTQFDFGPEAFLSSFEMCATTTVSVSCTLKQSVLEGFESFIPGAKELKPFESFRIVMKVKDTGPVSSSNIVEVSGGGAPVARAKRPVSVSATAPVFGTEYLSLVPEEEGGGVDVQAGSHPFQLTTTFALNQNALAHRPPALPRSLSFHLPAGLIANATAVAQCTEQQFEAIEKGGTGNRCPQDTAVGAVSLILENLSELLPVTVPVFNLTPAVGEPARFGFEAANAGVTIDASVRTGSDYGATATVTNTTQLVNFIANSLTIWGVPGDPRHDSARGWGCLRGGKLVGGLLPCQPSSEAQPPPFLTMPTACSLPFTASVEGVSWPTQGHPSGVPLDSAEHGSYTLEDEFERPLGVSGCNTLPFSPSIEVAPDVQSASTPTGLKVDVKVPQEVNQNASGLASSAVKDITVALPEGVVVNPAGGNGLSSCTTGQVGFTGASKLNPIAEPENETDLFTATLPEPLNPGMNLEALGFCPNASKIGTAKIVSPLIKDPVVGSVYLASQNANPFGSLVAAYIVAEDKASGTIVKLSGEVSLCEAKGEILDGMTCAAPGQLITKFKNSPQLAFEDAELHFFGGERAPLSTPAHCGQYTTNASFAPWSATTPVSSTSTFNITAGPKTASQPNGSPCPGPTLPFSPTLTAGTININAGAFTPLTTTISREDGNQDMQSVELHMPSGLEGILAGVKLCDESNANAGTCPPESQIGETTVSAGVGNDPVSVKGGKVYITEKYAGAPFGLSIVNPVKAGPFDLEHDTSNPNNQTPCDCVVVRAKIDVDPTTANLTITTDPSGPHAIPHLIDGIPVQIKKVNVLINREHFTFNPTNCNPATLTGTITADEGASSPVSVPFQPTNCAVLKFQPTITAKTAGKASKANGANLTIKIAYPKNAMGSQSWFNEAKLTIPKQLPARLTTIQQACLAATYEKNPEACPPASKVGTAVVHTQVLPVPLEGPVFFVSHGGTKFPDAVLHLHGYGINVDLVGETLIKNGFTSATFRNTPDVPFESIEVTLPTGKYSEFAANLPGGKLNFCGQHLKLPTHFKASNGLELNQETPITITGCSKTPTNTTKLKAALTACHKKHGKKRTACEHAAHKTYATKNATKNKKH